VSLGSSLLCQDEKNIKQAGKKKAFHDVNFIERLTNNFFSDAVPLSMLLLNLFFSLLFISRSLFQYLPPKPGLRWLVNKEG
jgi:hypothetical protein